MTEPETQQDHNLIPVGLIGPLMAVLNIVHWGLVIYALIGWLPNSGFWLIVYLIWLPALNVQWYFNNNSCILNNFESWLRTGKWRDENNPEEGAFIHTALTRITGLDIPEKAFDIFMRFVMLALWIGAFIKLRGL